MKGFIMLSIKVNAAVPLENGFVLVFFEDGAVKKFDVKRLIPDYPEFEALLNPDIFNLLKVEPGGYGISWTEDLDCSEGELYEDGIPVPLSAADFAAFAKYNLITTREAASILNCSKQNVDDLVKRGKLHPIKYDSRYNLFRRSEVEQRTWEKTPAQS